MAFGIAGMQAALASVGNARRSQERTHMTGASASMRDAWDSKTEANRRYGAIRDAFAAPSPTGAQRMGWDELPNGQYSALNVNIAEMPYAVCSGAGEQ